MPSSPTEQNHPGGFRPPHQLYPVSQYDPQPRWGPHQHSQSAPTAPSPTIPPTSSDTLPLYDPTGPLAEYPLGTWNASFPSTLSSAPTQPQTQAQGFDAGGGEVYYPTPYNIDTFPLVPYAQPSQAQRLHHAYPHPYTQTRHQMPPPSSGHAQIQRRDVYGALPQMQDNENTGPQSQQHHRQRTDPEQSSPQFIINQRTQELLAQATLSSTSSIDRQATAENRIGSASGRALMQSGGENRAGTSSTVQERPDHVGMPFVFGSVDDVFYGIPSSSIGQAMGKPNTGVGTGTTTTTTHVGISASTSALDHQGQNMVSAPRAPSTRPSSPPGGFVDRAPQAPAAGESGPDTGPGGSIQIRPHPHAESQSSHSQNLHTNPQSHPYTHPHSSYIHPRSHSSLSPASYGSYPPTGSSIEYSAGEYSTTGSSAGEYPTTTSSMDEYPTRGAYPPSASLMEQQYHSTGSSVSEYPTVEERGNASVPGPSSVSGSGSLSGQGDGTGYGHGHSESVSTVRGSSMSSSHPYHHEYGAHPVSIAPSTASQQAEQTGGQGRRPGIAQHASASVGPTFQGGIQSQTQQPGGRKVHQYPSRRVRSHHQLDQGSGLSSYPRRGSTTRANVSAQSGKGQRQSSSGQVQPQESAPAPRTRSGGATTGATTTTGKRARTPKRLKIGLTGNASATAVPIGGNSDDDSDDEEGDGEPPSTGPGGPGASKGPEVGGTGGGPGGEIGLRKAGACSHCKRLKMKCEFPEGATSCKRCTNSGYACIVEGRKPRIAPNKREYLLAQIRHKDQMIQSLLKQLHNPYTATPLSISAFQMATSPSDKDNIKIVDWMDRLQSSTKPPSQPCPSRMEMLRELRDSHNSMGGGRNNPMEDSDEMEESDETSDGEGTETLTSALPDAAVPIGLLANLSLDKDKGKGKTRQVTGTTSTNTRLEDDDDNVGVANKEYFMPGPANNLNIRKNLIEQHSPPDIVLHGLVTAADVEKLFEIFWGQINPFISLLDRKIHTPTTIFQRCPFLFTVICAISSRYYDKSEIYPVAMHFAKHAAANALIDGWKSVELCQAYILMSIYTVPARKWEEDRSWLYTGLAIRIATDLNLHQAFEIQPTTERQERELLNRIRVWMICFTLDRSTATQFGKPSTIKEDYITRNAANWYKKSLYNDKYDIHLCGYAALLRIVGQFHDDVFSDPDSLTGLNRSIDFLNVTLEHDNRLTLYFDEWTRRFNEESDPSDSGSAFRCKLLPFLVNYSRLVMYSFGFQHAFQRGMESNDQVFLQMCFKAATAVIEHMIDVLAPSGFMRSSPDGHFVFASFASAFLLKLLRPEFVQFLTRKMEDEIFELISRLIATLQELAIDERHTPHLYARFLAGLLTKHRKGGAGIGGQLQSQPPASQSAHKPPTQPHVYAAQQYTSPSHLQYSGSSSRDSSRPRYDNDAMQINAGSSSGTSRSPPPATTPPMPVANAHGPEYLDQPSLPLDVGSTDPADIGMDDMLSDIGALASMRALNDVWWGNMMMPGFTWPDAPLMSSLHDGPPTGLPSSHHPTFAALSAPETRVAM